MLFTRSNENIQDHKKKVRLNSNQ